MTELHTIRHLLAALKNSAKRKILEQGKRLHCHAVRFGCDNNIYVANTLIDMYSKCASMSLALKVFHSMAHRTAVSWTSLILGYVENGELSLAMDLYLAMDCQPDSVTFVAALRACAGLAGRKQWNNKFLLEKGIGIHKKATVRRVEFYPRVVSTLIDMYSKCGSMIHARAVFDNTVEKDIVMWNAIILGYVENGQSLGAIDLFTSMDCDPDSVTFVAALKACGSVGAMVVGQKLHAQICKLGLEQDHIVATCLVDFYGQCGSMAEAEDVFNSMYTRDLVSWTALVKGYSSLGDTARVFELVKAVQECGMQLDYITVIFVLTACSHAGLVRDAAESFQSMTNSHGVRATMEHYTCMVDMLGRANKLQEALSVAKSMPFEADCVVWTSLLGACKKWNNFEMAKLAFDALVADSRIFKVKY